MNVAVQQSGADGGAPRAKVPSARAAPAIDTISDCSCSVCRGFQLGYNLVVHASCRQSGTDDAKLPIPQMLSMKWRSRAAPLVVPRRPRSL